MKDCMRLFIVVCIAGMMLGNTGCGKKDSEILAIVGGQEITTLDFDRAIENLPENYKVLAESYKGKRKILDNLVKKELLVIEAENRAYHQDDATKKKIREIQSKTEKELDKQIQALESQREYVSQQVYENVLLNELNTNLKKEGLKGVEIAASDIKDYYDDYARKLKILNPAAKVPKLNSVNKQIQAILIEEKLIKKLEKDSSVEVKETRFRERYSDEGKDIIIE